jgi:hypothetical protein
VDRCRKQNLNAGTWQILYHFLLIFYNYAAASLPPYHK